MFPQDGGGASPSSALHGAGDDPLAGLGRQMPHNVEAEMAVLGAMLVKQEACGRVFQHISEASEFTLAEHRIIFDAIRKLHFNNRLCTSVAVKSYLGDTKLRNIGGSAYLNKLVDCAVTPINAGEYARLVADLATRREYIAASSSLADWAYDQDLDNPTPADAIDRIDALRHRRVGAHIEGLEKWELGRLHLVKTPPVEPLLGGWLHRQSRVFVTGAKKTGKSFLTMEIARAVGLGVDLLHWRGSGKPTRVLYVDGELGADALKKREAGFIRDYGDMPMGVVFLPFDMYPIPPIDTHAGHQMILNAADQLDAGMVLIDNYTALTDETLSDDVTIKRIRPLLNELMSRRIASISVAHAGHNEARVAGSHVMQALTTGTLHLNRDEDSPAQHCFGMATWQATREATPEDDDYKDFAYEIKGGHFVARGEDGARRGRMPASDGVRMALIQFVQCVANFGQVLTGNVTRPNGTSAVTRRCYLDWLMRRTETTELEAARSLKKLIDGGYVAKDGDFLWRA